MPELRIYDGDDHLFSVFSIHFKSKRFTSDIDDPYGKEKRKLEAKLLDKLMRKCHEKSKFGPIAAGDFNAIMNTGNLLPDDELDLLAENWKELNHFLNVPTEHRGTLVTYGDISPLQIDYIIFSEKIIPHIVQDQSGILPFVGPHGTPLPRPNSQSAKILLPSDHYAQVLTFCLP